MSTAAETPLVRFEAILEIQGRKKTWCAAQLGIEPETLRRRWLNHPGYAWRPGEQERLALALGVPAAMIWQDWQLESAESA